MASVQECVDAGMAWLDEAYPDHVKTFDPERFHVMCVSDEAGVQRLCVLMQAAQTDSWWSARLDSGLSVDQAAELGFLQYKLDVADGLQEAWLDAYAQRQAALTTSR